MRCAPLSQNPTRSAPKPAEPSLHRPPCRQIARHSVFLVPPSRRCRQSTDVLTPQECPLVPRRADPLARAPGALGTPGDDSKGDIVDGATRPPALLGSATVASGEERSCPVRLLMRRGRLSPHRRQRKPTAGWADLLGATYAASACVVRPRAGSPRGAPQSGERQRRRTRPRRLSSDTQRRSHSASVTCLSVPCVTPP